MLSPQLLRDYWWVAKPRTWLFPGRDPFLMPVHTHVAGAGEKRSTFKAWYIDARPVHHLPS